MQTTDLNGSMGPAQVEPLYQSEAPVAAEKNEGPKSGMENCEPADRCCLCWPIKCGMLVCAVHHVLSLFLYVIAYEIAVFG